jgi:hypothetical protein
MPPKKLTRKQRAQELKALQRRIHDELHPSFDHLKGKVIKGAKVESTWPTCAAPSQLVVRFVDGSSLRIHPNDREAHGMHIGYRGEGD